MVSSSGTYSFSPSLGDITIEAFERIGIRSSQITIDHMLSARMSMNLVLSSMANFGVNLWKVDLQTVPLVQGISTYSVPTNTIMMLDSYIRQYSMGSPNNITLPAFSTTLNSTTVTITQANNGMAVDNYISIIIPVSVGGIVLYGFYQVTSTPTVNTYTITASSAATSTVASGGTVPIFTTGMNSSSVNVLLANHGLVAGSPFVVQVSTSVGGITLYGSYTVATVVDSNNFTITSAYNASSTATVSENSGQAQIALQQTTAQPVDRVIMPISRTDYSSLPNKTQQGFPTVYWFDRLINPNVTLWQVPDGNGPYQLQYYRVTQIQDANPQMGQTVDIPYRFQEAFAASLAWHLARKWKPLLEAARKQDALDAMGSAMAEDREAVTLNLYPQLDGYYT